MRLLFNLLLDSVFVCCKLLSLVLPSVLVYMVLSQPQIIMNRSEKLIVAAHSDKIHEIIPNTRWSDLKPCGQFFDEQAEYEKAIQCVNEKVWSKRPVHPVNIPRCFIVSSSSPDVFADNSGTFNAILIADGFGRIGSVLGVYQPETRTVFVVENVDSAKVYRHELQHYFLHNHDPETEGGGHDQKIWQHCEEPYYTPSVKAKMIGAINNIAVDSDGAKKS